MELFDKKYVHFMWDDTLEGKKGYVSNNIDELIEIVEGKCCSDIVTVRPSYYSATPFKDDLEYNYRFAYYDPNYEVKKAYVDGKKIQYRYRAQEEWHDVQNENDFNTLISQLSDCSNRLSLRIKPEGPKRMTYRQLAEWLAKGNGEYSTQGNGMYTMHGDDKDPIASTVITHATSIDNGALLEGYKIRRWGSDEWIEPTVDVYNADCITKECE